MDGFDLMQYEDFVSDYEFWLDEMEFMREMARQSAEAEVNAELERGNE